jgi:hypothetical protein
MDEKELLMKVKTELRAFEVLLEKEEPVQAFEEWQKESTEMNVDEVVRKIVEEKLKELIFVEKIEKDALKKEIKRLCKFIDDDLLFLEVFPQANKILE